MLGGKAARQHLILLLAGRHLSASLFDRLSREVESLFFSYVITREPTRDFERNFARWAVDLRKVKSDAELEAFLQRRFFQSKAELSARFDDAFRRLYSDDVQQYRLRYILAKLTQHIELKAFGETEGTKWLSRFASAGFEIEHVYPQNPNVDAKAEFGDIKDSRVADRLGNLVLAEKSINASLGNRPFSKKRPVYVQSQLLLTRALTERPKVGTSTKINAAVDGLEPYENWNEVAIGKRQDALAKLAREAWNMPSN